MTFPCKEEFIAFERLAARQTQIYNDALDVGIPYADISNLDTVRSNLNEMLKVFKAPCYDYKAADWGNGRKVEFFIPIEMDEGMECGYRFSVTGNSDKTVAGGGFLTIDINHTSRFPRNESN